MNLKSENKNSFYFPNLDGFRFPAFIVVYLHHGFHPCLNALDYKSSWFENLKNIVFFNGPLGLYFFFVLSGFLITYLILKEVDVKDSFNLTFFYIRRILRVWPLYFLLLGISLVLFILFKPSLLEELNLPYYLLFLSNFAVLEKGGENLIGMIDITWSISIEEQFYLLWPMLFLLFNKKHYVNMLLAVVVFSVAFRIYYMEDLIFNYFHSLSTLYFLSMGGLIACLSYKSESFRNFFKNLNKKTIVVIYCIGFVYSFLNGNYYLFNDARLGIGLFFCFMILEQNYSYHSFYKMTNLKLFTRLNKYTYALYMLHPLSLNIITYTLVYLKFDVTEFLPLLVIGVVGFFIALSLSYLSYHFFEKKFLSLKNKFEILKR